MLCALTIKNMLLIEKADLEFKAGLNTLTGETGVGKSLLLDCLGFAMGWNNSKDLLRIGMETGEVTAEFSIGEENDLLKIFEKHDIPCNENVIIRRSINKNDNRKRIFLNDRNVSLNLLQKISKYLVELQGQNDNQSLLNEKKHLGFLDT